MRHLLLTAGLAVLLATPVSLFAQKAYDHGEVEAYGDLFRVAPSGATAVNYLGLGGRVGINTGTHLQLEAEMSYSFEQNYTNVTTSGSNVNSTTYTAGVRPISGFFGPKFQLGSTGPFRAFIEAEGGFLDFTTSCNAPAGSSSCFSTSLSNFGGSSTHFALFPGGGVEGFWGPLGVRVDVGDEIYENNGTYNNLRVTFGPTLRF